MNSNNSNHSDGSFHIYDDDKPRDKEGKLIEEKKDVKVEKTEVKKNDKKDRK
jgi:hypothetical protein